MTRVYFVVPVADVRSLMTPVYFPSDTLFRSYEYLIVSQVRQTRIQDEELGIRIFRNDLNLPVVCRSPVGRGPTQIRGRRSRREPAGMTTTMMMMMCGLRQFPRLWRSKAQRSPPCGVSRAPATGRGRNTAPSVGRAGRRARRDRAPRTIDGAASPSLNVPTGHEFGGGQDQLY
jgi:hypothetical protein